MPQSLKKPNQIASCEVIFTQDTITFEDKKTQVKSTWAAFEFPDGNKGAITVTKMVKGQWKPIEDVKKIIIEFQE